MSVNLLPDNVSNKCYLILHVPLFGEMEITKKPKWIAEGRNGQIAKYKQQNYDYDRKGRHQGTTAKN